MTATEPMTVIELGRLIRQKREAKGWSEQDLAEQVQAWEWREGTKRQLGINRNYVSEWETGKRGIGSFYAHRLSILLDIPSTAFIDRRRQRAPGVTNAPPKALFQLPPDIENFTGREHQVDEVAALLATPDGGPGTAVVITAISGKGGVGKTALALHVAHRVHDQFPGGQLYANLRGAEAQPLDPAGVLASFLRELGVDDADVPEHLDERARMFRARLAGRRLLVVLDNASNEAQVRPLQPGSPSFRLPGQE